MLFHFLRQHLRDHEFEQLTAELAEAKRALRSYKQIEQEQQDQEKREKEKVDPDFLVLVWATIGFAIAMFTEAGKEALSLQGDPHAKRWEFYIWLSIAIFGLLFAIFNSFFALELTKKYADSKSNREYVTHAYWVVFGVLLLMVGIFAIGILK